MNRFRRKRDRWVSRIGLSFGATFRTRTVPALLSEVGTLVLPSRSEVYGLVVTEALAAGIQVVVTDNSGVYPDVRELPGVFAAGATPASLRQAMQASALAWTGPLEQPAILSRTPEAMADDVLRACLVARSSK